MMILMTLLTFSHGLFPGSREQWQLKIIALDYHAVAEDRVLQCLYLLHPCTDSCRTPESGGNGGKKNCSYLLLHAS